jgi:hypothetical protein
MCNKQLAVFPDSLCISTTLQTCKKVINLEWTEVGGEISCSARPWEEFCEQVKNYMQPLDQGIGSTAINVNLGSVGLLLLWNKKQTPHESRKWHITDMLTKQVKLSSIIVSTKGIWHKQIYQQIWDKACWL